MLKPYNELSNKEIEEIALMESYGTYRDFAHELLEKMLKNMDKKQFTKEYYENISNGFETSQHTIRLAKRDIEIIERLGEGLANTFSGKIRNLLLVLDIMEEIPLIKEFINGDEIIKKSI